MIIKSMRIRTRGGSKRLLDHLLRGDENEEVTLLRGTEQDVRDAFSDARHREREHAVRHFIVAPGHPASREQMLYVVESLAHEFRVNPETAIIVEHRKSKADATLFDRHLHVIVPEIDAVTGKSLSTSHSYARQEKVARAAEVVLCHPITSGKHNAAVLAALRREGRADLADAIDRALATQAGSVLQQAFTHADHQRVKRGGYELPQLRRTIAEAWASTTTREQFEASLAAHGIVARPGEKPGTYIVETVDGTFLGALNRLAKARKADVLARMEKVNDRNQKVRSEPRRDDPWRHANDPALADPNRPGGAIRAGSRHPQRGGYAAGGAEADPSSNRAASDWAGAHLSPFSPAERRESGAGGDERLAQAGEALLLANALEGRANAVHELLASANRLAQPDRDRVMSALAAADEDAQFAKVMARSDLAEPPSLKSARDTAALKERDAIVARGAEIEARKLYFARLDDPPRPWWRRTIELITGAAKRREIETEGLRRRMKALEAEADKLAAKQRAAEAILAQEVRSHREAARVYRDHWRRLAREADDRIAAASAALDLFRRFPGLAHLGPASLMQLGRQIVGAAEPLSEISENREPKSPGLRQA